MYAYVSFYAFKMWTFKSKTVRNRTQAVVYELIDNDKASFQFPDVTNDHILTDDRFTGRVRSVPCY